MLMMPLDKRLIEGHPNRIDKIIQGDLREKTWETDGKIYTYKYEDGILLYDRKEPQQRPWFLIFYESGRRIID